MKQELSPVEREAIKRALGSPDFASGFKKFCQNHDEYHTRKVRDQQNLIPESVDQDTKRKAIAALHGGMAKAYGTMFAELQSAALERAASEDEA